MFEFLKFIAECFWISIGILFLLTMVVFGVGEFWKWLTRDFISSFRSQIMQNDLDILKEKINKASKATRKK